LFPKEKVEVGAAPVLLAMLPNENCALVVELAKALVGFGFPPNKLVAEVVVVPKRKGVLDAVVVAGFVLPKVNEEVDPNAPKMLGADVVAVVVVVTTGVSELVFSSSLLESSMSFGGEFSLTRGSLTESSEVESTARGSGGDVASLSSDSDTFFSVTEFVVGTGAFSPS